MKQQASWKRGFLTIAAGQAVSLVGSSAVQFALIWWLSSETGSAMMLALAGLMAFLPQLLLGPFVGVWVDRLSRKKVCVAADLFTGLAAAGFALYFILDTPPYWMACVVLGFRGLAGVFQAPAVTAIMPMLVPREELVRAGGLTQFIQSGAFMLGPVLGAWMYAALPMPVILLTDLAGALAASLAMLAVKVPDPQSMGQPARHFLAEMRQGLAVLRKDRMLFRIILTTALVMIFYLPLASFYPLMSSGYFKVSAQYASVVELVYAAGMMLAALLLSLKGRIKDQLRAVRWGLVGLGLTSLLSGLLPSTMAGFWAFAAVCLVMGGCANVYGIPLTAYMQRTIPPEAQGRAFSLMSSLMSAAMPLGLMVSGPVAEARGVPFWFALSGAATLALVAVEAMGARRFRQRAD